MLLLLLNFSNCVPTIFKKIINKPNIYKILRIGLFDFKGFPVGFSNLE